MDEIEKIKDADFFLEFMDKLKRGHFKKTDEVDNE